MHDNTLSDDILLLEGVPYALIPTNFVKNWKQWLNRPTETVRPDSIDNTSFICEHDKLVLDPNSPTDLDSSLVVIKRSDWEVLETLWVSLFLKFCGGTHFSGSYPGGPLIAIEKCSQGNEANYIHDIPVCVECRLKR